MIAPHRADARVLLVDDEVDVRQLAAHALGRLGFEVTQLGDAGSALKVLEAGDVDFAFILSDVRMPGMQGDEFARIVARRWPALPVLLTSGHARTGDITDGTVIYEVLPKPYTRAQLAAAIRRMRPA